MRPLVRQLRWQDIDAAYMERWITAARDEDLYAAGLAEAAPHAGDITSTLLPTQNPGTVVLRAREPMVVCGLNLIPCVLRVYHCQATWVAAHSDGDAVERGAILGRLSGDISRLLVAERVMLNFLQKLSGIATLTHSYVQALQGSTTRLLDTRKTTPGYRVLEKYAVSCGGGWNHRLGLYDRIMFKDNHIAACGGVDTPAFRALMQRARLQFPEVTVEVEIDDLQQLPHLLACQVDGVLFDNFTDEQLRAGVGLCAGRLFTEASGGIHRQRLAGLAKLGLDFISTGSTVHQATWVDIGLDWDA